MSNLTADQKRELSNKKVGTYFGDKKEKLTKTQEKVYAYIAGYIEDFGFSPTYQEIAIRTGLTTQAVEAHIKNLVKAGWIAFDNSKKFRKLELVPKQ